MSRYLLDTGIILGYARSAPYAQYCNQTYALSDPQTLVFTSVITEGEIKGLAERNGWGDKRRKEFQTRLNEFTSIEISSKGILGAYACIKAWTEGKSPPSAPNFPPPPTQAQRMGQQNDIWIAATAMVTNATLITTDKDFDLLHQEGILKRIWIDPKKAYNITK